MKRAKKPKLQREKLIAIIVKEARRLGRESDGHGLYMLLNESGLGWIDNRNRGSGQVANAIVVLAPLAEDRELKMAAHYAIWHRKLKEGMSREQADLAADRALARLGETYGPCGCPEWMADELCCGLSDRNKKIPKDALEQLRMTDPVKFIESVALVREAV